MSSAYISSAALVIEQITIYGGLSLMVTSTLGGLLNTFVLLSLRTFRQSSCAFYLTAMSFANIGQLFGGVLLSRLMLTLFGIELVSVSLFYCKLQSCIFQCFILTSFTCLCLATIDQYYATCSRRRWQQFCDVKVARRVMLVAMIVIVLYGIPVVPFSNHVRISSSNQILCVITNTIHGQYRVYVSILILIGFLPVVIAVVFGVLAYQNIRNLAYRTVPLVRRELDKQLTIMVLMQVIVNTLTVLPYTIVTALTLNTSITSDPVSAAQLQLSSNIIFILNYIYFAVSINYSRVV